MRIATIIINKLYMIKIKMVVHNKIKNLNNNYLCIEYQMEGI